MSQISGKKRPFSGPPEQIICEKCGTTFSMKKSLYSHMRNIHDENIETGNLKCGMCEKKFHAISQLQQHLQTVHNVHLKFDDFTFYCEADFLEWKKNVERDDQASFVFRNSSKKEDKKFNYYICHRSGVYNAKENRNRHLKELGSVKIGSTCPAYMSVSIQKIDEATEIKVNYQSIHVGHEKDVGRLPLSSDERLSLASSLNAGIPMSKILDKTKEKYSPTKRYGYTTRKDLHNIKNAFHIDKTILHKNDAISVDLMVKKMQNENSNYNPILIYKPVGELLPEYPNIDRNEFLLGIMNEAQQKLLELYNSCIMIDSTHGLNQYGFQLTTVMVHDENHEGLPVATLFSTRTAAETFIPFFTEIQKLVPAMKTSVLMTDDTNAYYNAWQAVFQDNSKHLLCSWHVVRSWNSNINSKVKDSANKEHIKAQLNGILTETDTVTFYKLMNDFVCSYTLKEKPFIDYFQNNYLKRPQKWAYCYRVGLGINTNMKLERWHRQLKYEESGGTVVKRLDKAITTVTNAIAKKLLSRLISMERGKLTARVALIRKRHRSCLEMNENYSIVENGNKFVVMKSIGSSLITYDVEKTDENCSCPIKCDDCGVCIHNMTCSCVDYCVGFVICKHIHFVCKNDNNVSTEAVTDHPVEENNLIVELNESKARKELEKDIIVPQLISKSNDDSKKNRVLNKLEELTRRLSKCDSNSDIFQFAESNIDSINAYFDLSKCPTLPPDASRTPANKLIEKQRNYPKKKNISNK